MALGDAQGAGSFVGAAQSPLRGEGRWAPAFPRQELGDRSVKHSPCYSTATSSQACRGAGGNSPGSLHLHAPSRSANTNPLLPEPSGPHPAWHLLAELRPRCVSPAASGEPRAGEEARGCSAPSDAEVPRGWACRSSPKPSHVLWRCFREAGPVPAPRGSGDATTTLPRRNLQNFHAGRGPRSVGTSRRFRGTRKRPMGSPSSLIPFPHGVPF